MARKREKEREREKRGREAMVSIYGLFIYVPLSGFLPPTPAEDSHPMRELYLTGGSARAHYFHVMHIAYWASGQTFVFPPLSFLNNSVDISAPTNTPSC